MFWRTSYKYQWIELDVATYNNTDIMNTFYQHKNMHSHTWSANSSETFIDYFIANRKLPEVFLDMRVYRWSDTGSDHFLTLDKLRFLPKLLHLPKNTINKENILHYKVRLLNDESISWPDEQIIQQKLKEIPESSSILLQWRNIKQ